MKKTEELVLAATSRQFDDVFSTLATWTPASSNAMMKCPDETISFFENRGVMIPRSYAESERGLAFRQPIALLVIRKRDTDKYFCCYRTGGEEPLLESKSMMIFGGHVTEADLIDPSGNESFTGAIFRSLLREIGEELVLIMNDDRPDAPPFATNEVQLVDFVGESFPNKYFTAAGVIDDRQYDVSRHHVGIVYEVEVDDCSIRDGEEMTGEFFTTEQIRKTTDLDNWSSLVLYKHVIR